MIVMWLFIGSIITNWPVESDESFSWCLSLKPLYDNLQLLLLIMMWSVIGEKWIEVL